MGRLWGLFSIVVAVGCSGSSPAAKSASHRGDSERPGIRLVLDDHLGWRYELTELTVLLDGELQYRRLGGPVTDPVLIDMPMTDVTPVGDEHTVSVRYAVRYQSGSVSSDCQAGAAQAWSFRRTRPAARMTLGLHAPGPTQSFDSLGLSLALRGATRRPLMLPSEVRGRREIRAELNNGCARYSESGQAVCRTQARIEVARADRDVILLNALHERLARMKALRRVAEKAGHRARSATDPDEKRHQSEVETVALAKIAAEFDTVRDGLICEYPVFVDGPTRWVSGPKCGGLEPIEPYPSMLSCGRGGLDPFRAECGPRAHR